MQHIDQNWKRYCRANNTKIENNAFKEVCFKHRRCYCFNDIIKSEDFDFDNILKDEKSHKNILIHNISCKALIGAKPLLIKFDK